MSSHVVAFDGFGQKSLAAQADGGPVSEVLQEAVRHYLSELGSDRFVLRVPDFVRSPRSKPGIPVGLELDEGDRAALTCEADRQGLAVEDLLGHAALLYLADADADAGSLSSGA
jgi:hypothetical protein